ncbi:MAG: undecaprenyl-diphosphate phosphatase [Lentisphaeria bacterium]
MDGLQLVKAAVLGVVEGVTEFLPISSTGHLIVAEDALGLAKAALPAAEAAKWNVFTIAIQLGAILAVCWEYRGWLWREAGRVWAETGAALRGPPRPVAARLRVFLGLAPEAPGWRFAVNVAVGFLPAAVAGLLFDDVIEAVLFSPVTVMATLLLGGLAIFAIEGWERRRLARGWRPVAATVEEMRPLAALKVGLAQVLALVPGTSRSGATIMGGLCAGLSRRAATEFSFFLAIPVMVAATGYKLLGAWGSFSLGAAAELAVGFGVAFLSALVVVKWLLRYVMTHDFRAFAWYRLGLGAALALWLWLRHAGG